MIKVIVTDLDGTLLNNQSKVDQQTIDKIEKSQDIGIRFMIATGRNFIGVKQVLKHTGLKFDYIVNSGAELRNSQEDVLKKNCLTLDQVEKISKVLYSYPVSVQYCCGESLYVVGTKEKKEKDLVDFFQSLKPKYSKKKIQEQSYFINHLSNLKYVSSLFEIFKESKEFFKIEVTSKDLKILSEVKKALNEDYDIAVASSFDHNLEITNIDAQKGPVIQSYIEELGFTMDDVMVIGDSLNDYSMLSLDFGATVAMGNALKEIKDISQFITKSNEEQGVLHAIEAALNGSLDQLS